MRTRNIYDDNNSRPHYMPSAAFLPAGTDLRNLYVLPDDDHHHNNVDNAGNTITPTNLLSHMGKVYSY